MKIKFKRCNETHCNQTTDKPRGLLSSATEPHKVKEDKIHVYEIGFISLVFLKDLSQNGDASSSSLY